jgi:hypothetical protein
MQCNAIMRLVHYSMRIALLFRIRGGGGGGMEEEKENISIVFIWIRDSVVRYGTVEYQHVTGSHSFALKLVA